MSEKKNVRKIFNEAQKREYIQYDGINVMTLENYFKRLWASEEFYNKDLADMNTNELKTSLLSQNIRGFAAREHIIYMIKAYINWAIANGKSINTVNPMDNIEPDDIGSQYSVSTQMLRSPEQVRHILNTVYNPDFHNQPNRACRDKLVFWLMYSNISRDEISILKKTDIDYDKRLIKSPSNNVYYDINDEIAFLWDRNSRQTNIEKSGVYNDKDIYYYELVDNDFLLRPILGKKTDTTKNLSSSAIRFIIFDIYKKYSESTSTNIMVSPANMRLSWIFYKLYLHEKAGEIIFPELMNRYFSYEYTDMVDLRKKMRRPSIDYAAWKEAFKY